MERRRRQDIPEVTGTDGQSGPLRPRSTRGMRAQVGAACCDARTGAVATIPGYAPRLIEDRRQNQRQSACSRIAERPDTGRASGHRRDTSSARPKVESAQRHILHGDRTLSAVVKGSVFVLTDRLLLQQKHMVSCRSRPMGKDILIYDSHRVDRGALRINGSFP